MKNSKLILHSLLLIGVFIICSSQAFGQKSDGDEVRVKFPRGKTSTILSGKIKISSEGPIYLVGVGANQKISVRLLAASGAVEIIITSPDGLKSSILTEQERSWSGTTNQAGDCKIIINPKHDNFSYKLEISVR